MAHNKKMFTPLKGVAFLLLAVMLTACSGILNGGAVGLTSQPQAQIATATPSAIMAATPTQSSASAIPATGQSQALQQEYINLYEQANPGVVVITVQVNSGFQSGVATGSGWIYDNQGDIVTNNHVVANGSNIVVTFFDGFEEQAKVIGTDPYSDLAVVQVQTLPGNVHTLPMGDAAQTKVGDLVVAIGSPFGLNSTMTTGVVSALGRDIPALVTNYSIPQAIQTDAAINPGNSGGPLLNMSGDVIGVNSQIASNGSNQSSGVGFAIPINIVKMVIPSLISSGGYNWPYLGIAGASVDLMIQKANNLNTQQGAYIDQVSSGSPAAQAGLQGSTGNAVVLATQVPTGGDVITAFNGQPVTSYDQLLALTAQQKPGDTVTLTILRNGKQQQVTVKLGTRPQNTSTTG